MRKILTAACLVLSLIASNAQENGQSDGHGHFIYIRSYGGSGAPSDSGEPPPKHFEQEEIRSIGLRVGKYVDALMLNGEQHGGGGGTDAGQLVLDDDEYIDAVSIRSSSAGYVDYLAFHTNKGRFIGGGGNGGDPVSFHNIRLLKIGGWSYGYLDKIEIEYIDNYKNLPPSDKNLPPLTGPNPN